MTMEETISEIDINSQGRKPKTSKLAVMSMVFGVLGPFFCGAIWIVSFNDFLKIGNGFIMAAFSCGFAWILGLALGAKSLEQVKSSEGQLVGREYAIAGIIISAAWMALIFVGLLLPALYYVNS